MRKIRHFFLTAAAVLCSTLTTWAAYDGTSVAPTQINGNYADYDLSADYDGYYVISTAEELYGFAELVNGGTTTANAVLTANIEVNENVLNANGSLNGTPTYSWTPIGTNANQFNGTFDGNNHTISGLYFNNTTKSNYPDGGKYVGLIGYANVATIKNVGVVGSYIWAYENVGGICGYCYSANTIIINCYNTGTVSGSSTSVGGICGFYGTQTNCHNTGTVTGSSNVGGVCGSAGILNKCYNTGTVSGSSSGVGGICGNSGTQTNSYNTGTVTGSSNVGGICGYIGTQTDCYYLEGCGSKNTRGVSATAEEFASGKITYLLNGSTSEGDLAWYQTLGSGGDAYPLLDNTHAVVYATQPCISEFSNENNNARKEHSQMNATGCCTDCGQYIAQGATVVTESNYSGLNLTADFIGYYAISNSPDLYWFAKEVYNGSTSINAVLTADIVVNENVLTAEGELNGTPSYSWTPIGTSSQKYAGTFDGNGHTISGLYFNNTTNRDYPNGGKYAGLIGYAYGATIKNVGVIGSYIRGDQYVSGICGYGSNSSGTNTTITNCYNTGMVTGSAEYVGGICGSGGVQTNCHNTGMVSGFKYVGGICGQYGTQTKCYNTGTITSSSSSSSSVGGICGSYGTQTNCYNTGTVSGSNYYVGGICGYCYYNVTPINCYNTGSVSGYYDYSGGICGNKENSGVEVKPTNCYYLAGCCRKDGGGVSATAEVFASGKITYLLNGSTSGDDNTWRQTFGNGGDAYPVLDNTHGVVYASQPCTSEFSNKNNDARKEHPSMNAAGHCTACDQFIAQGTLVTESNYSGLNLTADFIGYYAIGNSGELYWLANEVNNGNNTINAVLTADIVVNENVLNADGTLNGTPTYSWTPIGTWDKTFNGTFDGNGHIISGLYFNNTTDKNSPNGGNDVGLIGYANGAKGTKIKNVGVIDSYIRGRSNVGGICGCGLNYTNITNCYNTGTVSGSSNGIGGICGYDGNITNCYNTGMVSGSSYYVGGICGSGGKQTNCYYLEGCAKDGNNVEQYGVGANQKGQTIADVEGKTISATAAEYASGKIAYMLNGGTFEVTTWRQTLFADASPVLNTEHNIVTGYVTEAENVITVTGDLVVATDYEIAEGKTLTVPEGASLTILEGASLTIPEGALLTTTGEAVITNNGTIIANGSISGNNLAGSGSFIYNALSANDVALVKTSFIYKGSAFTLDDDVEATISNRTFCGKTFSFDASLTSVSYKNNRNVGNNATVTWTNTNGSSVSKTFGITPKTITITATAESRVYDRSIDAEGSLSTADIISGDNVTISYANAEFNNKNVGTGKVVTFSGITIDGTAAANYALSSTSVTANANITAKGLTLSNFTAGDKTFDGTTNATGGAFSDDRVSGDALEFSFNYAFADKNAANAVAVNFSNIAISGGADKGNYTLLTTTGTCNAQISPVTDEVAITITLADKSVVYSGAEQTYNAADALTIEADNALYNLDWVSESGNAASVSGTNAGEYAFGWNAEMFSNSSPNFTNVTFNVTDGKLIINPNTNVVVTITENSKETAYNTEEQSVSGYSVDIDDETNVYRETDFTFSGNAVAAGTTVGTYPMDLSAADFSNTNTNFANVTFNIVDGALTINKAAEAPNKPAATMETRYIVTQLVALPENWKWVDEQQALEEGSNVATANYVGADKGNYVIESVDVTITRLECLHNEGNEVLYTLEPTCTHKGYTGNLSCKLCGEIYEMGDSIPALGHNFVETVVAPTCTTDGYTEHLCNRCQHIEYSDTVAATGHKADSVVFENVVAATCTAAGSYDSVVYCSVCQIELSRDVVDVPAAGHKADSVAIENIVAATRTAAGSYDSVVYCSVCRVELSRTTIEVPQIVAETIKLASKPNKVEYKQGEALDVKGGKITIGYSDKSAEDYEILTGWVSDFNSEKVGKQTLTVSFEAVSSTLTTTFDVTVSAKDDDNTGVDEDAANMVNIYAYQNVIVVENATEEISVYNAMGALVCKDAARHASTADGLGARTEIRIDGTGVYIVKVGDVAKRVFINR